MNAHIAGAKLVELSQAGKLCDVTLWMFPFDSGNAPCLVCWERGRLPAVEGVAHPWPVSPSNEKTGFRFLICEDCFLSDAKDDEDMLRALVCKALLADGLVAKTVDCDSVWQDEESELTSHASIRAADPP